MNSHDKLKTLNFHYHKLVRMVTHYEELPSLKSDDSLIDWPTCGEATIKFPFTRLKAPKFGRVLTSGWRFRM